MTEFLPASLKVRLYLLAIAVLLTGLGCSLFIYLTVATGEESSLVAEYQNSKAYRHELEVYGGKMSLLADQLSRWFAELWQGKSLAVTIAVITMVLFLTITAVALRIPTDRGNRTLPDSDRDKQD